MAQHAAVGRARPRPAGHGSPGPRRPPPAAWAVAGARDAVVLRPLHGDAGDPLTPWGSSSASTCRCGLPRTPASPRFPIVEVAAPPRMVRDWPTAPTPLFYRRVRNYNDLFRTFPPRSRRRPAAGRPGSSAAGTSPSSPVFAGRRLAPSSDAARLGRQGGRSDYLVKQGAPSFFGRPRDARLPQLPADSRRPHSPPATNK